MFGAALGDQGDGVDVRPMVAEDSCGLSELVFRCYGDGYSNQVIYRPDDLSDLIRSGAHSGAVAVAGGQVVGHMAFRWPHPDATVVEAGITVVDPEWRGKGLMGRLAIEMGQMLIDDGAVGFVHFPTTAHTVMQRASLASGGRETGIMVAYLPPDARDQEIAEEGSHRLSVTVVYQPGLEAPGQDIFCPDRYEDHVLATASSLGLTRTRVGADRLADGGTVLRRSPDPAHGVSHVQVHGIGGDIADQMAGILEESDARVVHVDLPMNDPGINHAAEGLRSLGFAYSAWLPGWAGHDMLRLQWIDHPSVEELSPTLFSDEACRLMDSIRAELPASG